MISKPIGSQDPGADTVEISRQTNSSSIQLPELVRGLLLEVRARHSTARIVTRKPHNVAASESAGQHGFALHLR